MTIVHALEPDGEHCVCGQPFPCPPWLAATRAEVHPVMWPETVETYRDAGVPEHVTARMETALIGETR